MLLGIYEGKDFSIYNLLIFCLAKTGGESWLLRIVLSSYQTWARRTTYEVDEFRPSDLSYRCG